MPDPHAIQELPPPSRARLAFEEWMRTVLLADVAAMIGKTTWGHVPVETGRASIPEKPENPVTLEALSGHYPSEASHGREAPGLVVVASALSLVDLGGWAGPCPCCGADGLLDAQERRILEELAP